MSASGYSVDIHDVSKIECSPVQLYLITFTKIGLIASLFVFLQLACYLVEGVMCIVDCGSHNTTHHNRHQDVGTSLS